MAERLADRRGALKIKQAACAAAVGMPVQHYAELEDDDAPRNLCLADAMGLPVLLQRELLRDWAASLGCVVAEVPHVESPEEQREHLAATIREVNEVAAQYALTTADGVIDPSEAPDLAREAREGIECLAAIEAAAVAAIPKLGPRRLA